MARTSRHVPSGNGGSPGSWSSNTCKIRFIVVIGSQTKYELVLTFTNTIPIVVEMLMPLFTSTMRGQSIQVLIAYQHWYQIKVRILMGH